MTSIDDALALAVMAHRGQKDLDGKPAIFHPIRVGLSGENENEIITGFLHDVVEDTDYSFDDLKTLGVGSEIIEALMLLTHSRENTYDEYIEKLLSSHNKLALSVKRHDLVDNLSRNDRATEQKRKIYEKHESTLEKLKNENQRVIMNTKAGSSILFSKSIHKTLISSGKK